MTNFPRFRSAELARRILDLLEQDDDGVANAPDSRASYVFERLIDEEEADVS